MEQLSLQERAIRMAVRAHEGQTRRESNTPYITHPVRVALLLAHHGFEESVIAAGLVHDVIEDSEISIDELRVELGDSVADIVACVTNDDSIGWEEKKLKYIETVRQGGPGAKAVATADKIHNAESLLAAYAVQGTDIWKYFNAGREKKIWFERKMLDMLKEEWEHPLIDEYASLVRRLEELT
jgi:(p)ppGpp synthase/HD superfamily hydrolase